MKLPENVVPMPAEQRAELKQLATRVKDGFASGSWQPDLKYGSVCLDLSSWQLLTANPSLSRDRRDRLLSYVGAVSPDITLATFAYVEALEKELAEATSRATKAESRAEGLQAELAEQETAALQWAKTLASYQNELSRLRAEVDFLKAQRLALLQAVEDEHLSAGVDLAADLGVQFDPNMTYEYPAPTPPPSSPAAAGPGEAGWFSPLVFDSAADYDASVARNVERIKSGEVKPIEQEEEEREVIGTYETSGLPVYEGDDYVTDVEGCYLTRAEADELKVDDEKRAPTTTGEGKEVQGV